MGFDKKFLTLFAPWCIFHLGAPPDNLPLPHYPWSSSQLDAWRSVAEGTSPNIE